MDRERGNVPDDSIKYCKAFGWECVLNGCFFENRLKEINPQFFTPEDTAATNDEIIDDAHKMGCPKADELG